MTKIRTLSVDDEPFARLGLRREIERAPDLLLIGECAHGREAVDAILRLEPELVVLDLQLPELDGFEVVEAVGVERMPALIFVTAFDQHALRAFEAHALDYVLKPFESERMQKALARAKRQAELRSLESSSAKLQAVLDRVRRPAALERLVLKNAGRISFLNVEEIDWIGAADNYVEIHAGADTHLLHETLSRLEARLDADKFLRVHRSLIVNVSRIGALEPRRHGEYRVVLRDGTTLVSGRTYRARLEKLLGAAL